MVFVVPELSTEEEDEEEQEEEEEGDDEEGSSSDEFTDSIEEDDNKVTARSLAAVQVRTALIFSSFKVLFQISFSRRSVFIMSKVLCKELRQTFCLNSLKAFGPESVTRDPARGSVSCRSDIKQLEEEKQTLEIQLEEISAQLEGDGFTSVAQMRFVLFFKLLAGLTATLCKTVATFPSSFSARCVLQRLQQENQTLRESGGRAGAARLRGNKHPSPKSQTWELEEEEEGDEEERVEKEEGASLQNMPAGKRGAPGIGLSQERGKRQCTRPVASQHNKLVT